MEIAGHEFWGADGKTIWYDLQTPRGKYFWIAGYNIATGLRTRYHLRPIESSVHFNVSANGKFFSDDGNDNTKDGKWIYLFHPIISSNQAETGINKNGLVKTGILYSQRLVNMSNHDYAVEPNATFTPDMKWLIFRSNISGVNQVYAVELRRRILPTNPSRKSLNSL